MSFRAVVIGLSLLMLAGPVAADVIHLSTGGIVRGKIVKETARAVTVEGLGGKTVVPRSNIERIERGSSDIEHYRKRLAKIAEGDAEAHFELGKWLTNKRLAELARRQFQEVVTLDPDHAGAREALGYVRKEGTWVLTGSSETGAAAKPKRKARLDVPASEQLNSALKATRSKEQGERAAAWEVLADGAAETERLLTILEGEGKLVARLRGFLSRADAAAAEATDAEALRPHVERYVAEVQGEALNAALGSYANAVLRKHKRVTARMADLFGDYTPGKAAIALEKRTEKLNDWATHRDAALQVIFDKSIYPDANHGRSGQPIVDEHVEKVRAVWPAFDEQVSKDLRGLLALSADEAKQLIDALTLEQQRLTEVKAALATRGQDDVVVPEVPAACRVLVGYRAGHIDWANGAAGELNPWEQELLRRLRDERVREHNLAFKTKSPYAYGVQPSGEEVEQVRITNDYRIMMARPAVEVDPRLVQSARGHSADMSRLGFFDHTSRVAGKETPSQRMAQAGYPGAGGENISLGSTSPMATHVAWYNSSGHHRNILTATWTAMGSGKDGQHWTQNFGRHATLKR